MSDYDYKKLMSRNRELENIIEQKNMVISGLKEKLLNAAIKEQLYKTCCLGCGKAQNK